MNNVLKLHNVSQSRQINCYWIKKQIQYEKAKDSMEIN